MSKKVKGIVVVWVDDGGTTFKCSWILILLFKAIWDKGSVVWIKFLSYERLKGSLSYERWKRHVWWEIESLQNDKTEDLSKK